MDRDLARMCDAVRGRVPECLLRATARAPPGTVRATRSALAAAHRSETNVPSRLAGALKMLVVGAEFESTRAVGAVGAAAAPVARAPLPFDVVRVVLRYV